MHPLIPPTAANADILPAAPRSSAEAPAPLDAFRQVFAQLQARAPQTVLAPVALSGQADAAALPPVAARNALFPAFGGELSSETTLDVSALTDFSSVADPLAPQHAGLPAALAGAAAVQPELDTDHLAESLPQGAALEPAVAAQAQQAALAQAEAQADALAQAQPPVEAQAQLAAATAQFAATAPAQAPAAPRAAASGPNLAQTAASPAAILDGSAQSAVPSGAMTADPQLAVQAATASHTLADAPLPAAPAFASSLAESAASALNTATAPAAAQTSASSAPASLPQSSLALTAPLDSARWQQDMGRQLASLVRHGDQRVSLHLNPAELGPLVVELKVSEQQAQLQFLSAHAPVRQAVEQAIPQLREALAEQGISLGEAQVGEQRQGSERQQAGEGRHGGREQPAVLTDSTAPAAGSPVAQPLDGRVNLYI